MPSDIKIPKLPDLQMPSDIKIPKLSDLQMPSDIKIPKLPDLQIPPTVPNMKNKVSLLTLLILLCLTVKVIELLQSYYVFPPYNGINRLSFDSRICNKHPHVEWHAQLTDKARVKEIISDLNIFGLYVPKTYAVLSDCDYFDYNVLPDNFVMKPTHYSGVVHICKKCNDSPLMCNRKIKKILKHSYNTLWKRLLHKFIPIVEHHYDFIRPRIIIEEYIRNNDDWKIHVYKSRVLFVHLCSERISQSACKKYAITPEYQKLSWTRFGGKLTQDELPPCPPQWEKMKSIAKQLATKLIGDDYVRVDLYVSDGKIFFSELTFTPDGGRARFSPKHAEVDILK